MILSLNKKVLHECKRHTAHCTASVCCADQLGGTYPGQGGIYLGWGYLLWPGGYLPWPVSTYPNWGVPTLAGGYLPWLGYPPGVDRQMSVKTVPSSILWMWVVNKPILNIYPNIILLMTNGICVLCPYK